VARISSGAGSKQNYGTPWDFMKPMSTRFGKVVFDLAAEARNTKHKRYFAKPLKGKCASKICNAVAHDSFEQDWAALTKKYGGILWLNPPFKKILRWILKCALEAQRGANIVLLSSAAVGSDWYLKNVFGVADTCILNGRLTFDEEPFMRDLMLTHWWPGMTGKMNVWDWRQDVMHVLQPMDPGLLTTTYRTVVQQKLFDGETHTIQEGGFKSIDDARIYIEGLKGVRDDVRQVRSQIICQKMIEDVVIDVSGAA